MELALIIIFFLVWGGSAIVRKLTPPDPPIDDMTKHLETVMKLSTPKERRDFIKRDAARRRANLYNNQNKKD